MLTDCSTEAEDSTNTSNIEGNQNLAQNSEHFIYASEGPCHIIFEEHISKKLTEEISENITTDYHDNDVVQTSASDTMSLFSDETSSERLNMEMELSLKEYSDVFPTKLIEADYDSDFELDRPFEGFYLSSQSQTDMKKQSHRKTKGNSVPLVAGQKKISDEDVINIEKRTFSEDPVKIIESKVTANGNGNSPINTASLHENQHDLSDLLIMKLQGIGKITSEKTPANDDVLEVNYLLCGDKKVPLASPPLLDPRTTESSSSSVHDVTSEQCMALSVGDFKDEKDLMRESRDREEKTGDAQRDSLQVPKTKRSTKTNRRKTVMSRCKRGKAVSQDKTSVTTEELNIEEKNITAAETKDNSKEIEISFTKEDQGTIDKETENVNAPTTRNAGQRKLEREREKADKQETSKDGIAVTIQQSTVDLEDGCSAGSTMPNREGSANSNHESSANPSTLERRPKLKAKEFMTEKGFLSSNEENKQGKESLSKSLQNGLPSIESVVTSAYYDEDYFKRLERLNLAEQRDLKKTFRAKIAEARRTLREARKKAQEQTVAKRFDEAVRRHKEMQQKRSMRKSSTPVTVTRTAVANTSEAKRRFTVASLDIMKKEKLEVREIHKAEAQLDRAKAAKKLKERPIKREPEAVSRPTSIKAQIRKDRERMERYEVEYLISELRYLNMEDYATKLVEALEFKDELEVTLRHQLKQKRQLALQMAKKQKMEEQARIREEEKRRKLEEKERLERERKEREALELKRRREEALKRREQNLKLWEMYNFTVLATDKSRSFTYSYLPTLKEPRPVTEKKPEKLKLKNIKPRYLQHDKP